MNISEKPSNPLLAKSQASSLESSLMGLLLISALILFLHWAKLAKSWDRSWGCSAQEPTQHGSSAQLLCQPVLLAHSWHGKIKTWLLLNFWLCLGAIQRGDGTGCCQLAGGNCKVLLACPMLMASGLNKYSSHHFQCQASDLGRDISILRSPLPRSLEGHSTPRSGKCLQGSCWHFRASKL